MKRISIVTPCYNEEGNVRLLAQRVAQVFAALAPDYTYEHIFADNASEDGTLSELRALAQQDTRTRVIVNACNFGPSRSLFNALLAAQGDAIVLLAADLQDPPELIPQFIQKWEQGYRVVFGIRKQRREFFLMTALRKGYYRLLKNISEDDVVKDAGDFVLFDREVQDVLKRIRDANPYIRGLLSSLGFTHTGIPYPMAGRHSGRRPRGLFKLFVYGLNGFINHTAFPLRLATLIGFSVSLLSLAAAFVYLVLKLIFWDVAPQGFPTLFVGMFFLAGIQLFLLGYLGEIANALFRQSKNLPLVIEKERINFDTGNEDP